MERNFHSNRTGDSRNNIGNKSQNIWKVTRRNTFVITQNNIFSSLQQENAKQELVAMLPQHIMDYQSDCVNSGGKLLMNHTKAVLRDRLIILLFLVYPRPLWQPFPSNIPLCIWAHTECSSIKEPKGTVVHQQMRTCFQTICHQLKKNLVLGIQLPYCIIMCYNLLYFYLSHYYFSSKIIIWKMNKMLE